MAQRGHKYHGIIQGGLYNFRRDRHTLCGRVFICVKNNIDYSELWVDDDFEIIAEEVKGIDRKYTWEIGEIYRAPNEDMRVIEKLATWTGFLGNSMSGILQEAT